MAIAMRSRRELCKRRVPCADIQPVFIVDATALNIPDRAIQRVTICIRGYCRHMEIRDETEMADVTSAPACLPCCLRELDRS